MSKSTWTRYAEMSETRRHIRPFVEEHTLEDGRRINLLAEGRLVNLAAAEGHPPSVMDMSFANQALASEYIAANHTSLEPGVHVLPRRDRHRDRVAKIAVDGNEFRTPLPQSRKNTSTLGNLGPEIRVPSPLRSVRGRERAKRDRRDAHIKTTNYLPMSRIQNHGHQSSNILTQLGQASK